MCGDRHRVFFMDDSDSTLFHRETILPTRRPAHQALFNVDIFLRILDEFKEPLPDAHSWQGQVDFDPHKSTLYALALVCRAFTDASLDLLWRIMDSLEPVRGLLPEVEDPLQEVRGDPYLRTCACSL